MSVYTTVSQAQLCEFLTQFDAGALVAFEGISAGIENTNYFVDTTHGRYVLTIFEHHTFDDLQYFLKLMAWMSEAGVATAHPLAGKDGQYLRLLLDKPAALVERLRGKSVDVAEIMHCSVMGKALAEFHLAGQGFTAQRANDRDIDWMLVTRDVIAPLATAEDLALIDAELSAQQAINISALPQGVTHADLFLDNALFDGEALTGIIDLYYACHGYWLYDVAVTMNDWCRQADHQLDTDRVRAFLSHYAHMRPWTEMEQQLWPMIARRAALRFFLSRLHDQLIPREGELTQTKDPVVFKCLLQHLQQACPSLVA